MSQKEGVKPTWKIVNSTPFITNGPTFPLVTNVSASWENDYIKDRSKASFFFASGRKLESIWRRVTLEKGKYGGFYNDKPSGYGTMVYKTGDRF